MFRWKVGFTEEDNETREVMRRILPLDIMKLSDEHLDKQFVVYKDTGTEYSSRELIFKFYESEYCKILYLTGENPVNAVAELLSELPPVYVFHAELSLTNERFADLSYLNVLNAMYAVKINGYARSSRHKLFLDNLDKIMEANLPFYWID